MLRKQKVLLKSKHFLFKIIIKNKTIVEIQTIDNSNPISAFLKQSHIIHQPIEPILHISTSDTSSSLENITYDDSYSTSKNSVEFFIAKPPPSQLYPHTSQQIITSVVDEEIDLEEFAF
jgi:hypothetical protein